MWTKQLTIDHTTIDDFARLSGDYNSLHMDEEAARTYSYRKRVAHGMIGVSQLMFCPLIQGHTIKKISGRFNRPVFVGEQITLSVNPADADTLQFSIATSGNTPANTTGKIILGKSSPKLSLDTNKPFIHEQLLENAYQIHELTTGLKEQFTFILHPTLATLAMQPQVPLELIPVIMSSTMVGMRLPGAQATYVDFNFEFLEEFPSGAQCRMEACVNFVSVSAGVMIETVEVYCGAIKLAQGKITVKIQEASKKLPAFSTIKSSYGSTELNSKTALITGSSRGIGATTAKLLAAKGANVIINFHSSKSLAQEVVDDINAGGGKAIAIQADVSDPSHVQHMFDQICKSFGGLDVLVNNAVADAESIPLASLTWEQIQRDIDVVVKGAFLCSQKAVEQMVKRGGGHIIHINTVYTQKAPSGMTKYVVAKSALAGLASCMALELQPKNIRVNTVMPTLVETDLSKNIPPIIKEKFRVESGGKFPTTLDVAVAIASLTKPDAPTGQTIYVK